MIKQSVKMAWKAIVSNKMRSFLTMLGIIIGVMSLVVLVSLVNTTTESVNDQISGMGSSLLTVNIRDDKENPMKLADVMALADKEEIEDAAPLTQSSTTVSGAYSEETANIYGTTGAYFTIKQQELYSGRFLKRSDIDNHTSAAVVNAGLAKQVLGRMDVVGETISINGVEFQIVGVLAAKDSDSTTTETYEAYIPYTSLIRISEDVSSDITSFCVSASSEETLTEAEDVLTEEMLNRLSQDEDAFTIINQSTVMEAMQNVNNTLALMLGGIAAISLLVGGIGIMNIMLVSVTERTREIGIRKAIGAGRSAIMMQFLIEALMLSLMGCAMGVFMSWIALRIITIVANYPANKAAKMKPIEALRYTG
ncbi:MAG: ABC transporter permease [Lachnospiraceae bacterium]